MSRADLSNGVMLMGQRKLAHIFKKEIEHMILIITMKDDVHADLVIKRLNELGVEVFRFNTECATDYQISISLGGGNITNIVSGRVVDLSKVGSVWLRRRASPEAINTSPKEYQPFLEQEWASFYRNICALLRDRFWISSANAIDKTKDKMRQLRIAKELGFTVPETLITNCLKEAIVFQERLGRCVYKPHDGSALNMENGDTLYTSIIAQELVQSPEMEQSLLICPGIFQPYIEKAFELRVTVVGEKVFAAKIESQNSEKTKTDWRRYDFENTPHSMFQLPASEEARCISIVKRLGLEFGAIDMIMTPQNELYFLEINANGQWAWIELLTGYPISAAIADLLVCNDV